MKKQTPNAIAKKFFTMLVAFAIVFCSSVTSYALPDNALKDAKAAEVTYKGAKDKLLMFKVDFKNEAAQPFQLVIMNDQNEVIYAKRFDPKPLHTDVYLSDVPESCKLTFTIATSGKDYKQSFEINSKAKFVEEFLVKGIQ